MYGFRIAFMCVFVHMCVCVCVCVCACVCEPVIFQLIVT